MIRFADFEFDERAGELRRNGTTRRLEPQPARVLAVLVERAGDLVSRAELQQRVWSGETYVDFDRGLNYCIAQIREALGDSASEPRFIETLPRRGYRFIAPIVADSVRDGLPPSRDASAFAEATADRRSLGGGGQTVPNDQPPGSQRINISALSAFSAVALVVALIAGASILMMRRDAAKAKPDTRVRLAVVPFDNETGVAEYDRLAQTLTDATVARLAADPVRLAVIGNAAVLRVPRSNRDLLAIGSSLNVGHVVLGQVQQIDGHLRITTHLVRTGDQSHLWAHRFEPSASETGHLDRDVSEAVANAIAKRLLGG
ncbi:MAG TPA: winged helix-turn-helix domain-containing protein [Vicinamibacterales bacterium]|nr:winged helix-turn-helix domain-containing protein [Vicinamibacterales bacterium]